MAVRLREFPWASQPPEAADINWLHSRSIGLCFFAPLSDSNGFRDLVRGNFLTRTGLGSAVTSGGVSTRLFGTSSYADFTPPPEIGPTTPFSVSWTQEAISPSAYGTILNVNFGTAGVHSAFVIYQAVADAAYYFTAGPRNTNGAHSWSASIGAITAGRVDRFTLVAAAGSQSLTASDWTLYRNGALISRGTSSSFGVNTASAGRIGARDAASDPWEGSITDLRMWARALTPTEAAEESFSAGDLYEPQRIWVPVAAAGGSVTLTVADAAHAHAADAITLASASNIAVADSAHAHTSEAPALSADTSISVQDQAHAHTDGGPLDLSGVPSLAVNAVAHGHTSDAITLSSESLLAIADALHGHTSTSVVLVLPSAAYLLTEPFKDWGGNLLALATIPGVVVLDPATRAVLLSLADQVTQADARLRLEDSALPTGQPVVVVSFNADGSARGVDTYTVQ